MMVVRRCSYIFDHPGQIDAAVVFTDATGPVDAASTAYNLWINTTNLDKYATVCMGVVAVALTRFIAGRCLRSYKQSVYNDATSPSGYLTALWDLSPRRLALQTAVDSAIVQRAAGLSAVGTNTLRPAVEQLQVLPSASGNPNAENSGIVRAVGAVFMIFGLCITSLTIMFLICGEKQAKLLGAMRM